MSAAHIVVINDDPIQLKSASSILESAGHRVRSYLNASEALAALAGRDAVVDLFVVDLHMPGIDGWKLCRLLRSPDFPHFNDTPVLIVSATFTGDDVERITTELGANAFLQVPFTSQELRDFVEALLAGRRPSIAPVALVVDDDEAVTRALTRALEAHGYEARVAATVEEARAIWAAVRIDVALLDYHLPDGTCEELLDEYQKADATSVALVMTGDSDPSLPVSLLARGADAYLRKPFDARFAIELARRSSRERSLMRVEAVLEKRTQELRASEKRYRSLFRTVPDLMVLLDEAQRIVEANPVALECLSGGAEPGLTGRSFLEFVDSEHLKQAAVGIREVLTRGQASFETVVQGDGATDPLPVEVSGRVVDMGGQSGILLVGRDLTERREAEQERRHLEAQIQHAQRLESLGVLAGGVAHDFNNLLVGILGNASLALTDLPEHSPIRESLVQIEVAARRAAELTNQILTFAGKSKVAEEVLELPTLVREMGQLVQPAISKKARVSFRISREPTVVRGDPGQLRQLVMNLLINASDALEDQVGTITVATGVRTVGKDELRAAVGAVEAVPGTYAYLEVTDDGCGMGAEVLPRIFDPFFTTKAGGRGLGLAATLGVVRTHGGYLLVRSAPGVGTTFTVLLPPHREKESTDDAAGTEGEEDRLWSEGGTVLVVDDEDAVRGLARAVLARNGFQVVEAGDGQAGLCRLEEAQGGIDLIVLDLSMPRMGGVEVLSAVRDRHPELPVLLSSGYAQDAVPQPLLARGPTAFVRKPYTPSDLMKAVTRLLRGNGNGAGTVVA